jgi:hypothetical protein
MGRLSAGIVQTQTTDAQYRAWAQFIHDGLLAAGLVQSADTGQANLATMTLPVAINTYPNYEVFKFADALSATKPIFVKVEYGCSGATTRPSVRFTVGPTTDGAGGVSTIWGAVMTPPSTAGANFPHACWASGPADGSGFVLSMWSSTGTASTAFQFWCERSRDSGGNPTGDGLAFGYGAGSVVRTVAYTGTWGTSGYADLRMVAPLPTPDSLTSTVTKGLSVDGVTFPWIPCVFTCPGVAAWRSAVIMGVSAYDAGMGSIFSVSTHGGTAKQYLQPGLDIPNAGIGTYTNTVSTNYYLSQIWEP